jgi:MSHA biogenesis protein MshK
MRMIFSTALLSLALANAAVALTAIDPTKPYEYDSLLDTRSYAQDAEMLWALSGIKIKTTGKTAILNGKLVREGDALDGARIIEIKPAEVILLRDQQRFAVKLLIRDIKSPASGATDEQ